MAINDRIGSKVVKAARREDAPGTRVDPYPYVGIVKNNLDPTLSGRLQVYIPDLGGPADDANNWRTVSYSSPYMGYTSQVQSHTDTPSPDNSFTRVSHTYGMWMVPPDIGVEVIVIFIAGDPLRGYFIGCVNSNLSHFMLPGIAGTQNVDVNSLTAEQRKSYAKGDIVPVVEFNEYTKDFTNTAFYLNNKPVHVIQYNILRKQGLDQDTTRGAISSSSQRESPSQVFGISTPGRPLDDPADTKESKDKYTSELSAGKIDPKYLKIKSRKGGHVFVMDDGAALGEDQLVRLRTATGHQILMHDTNKTIYIAHADGGSWIELGPSGSISAYASGSFNVRSEGTLNLHSDTNININAGGSINMKSGSKIKLETTKTELLTGTLKVESSGLTEFKSGAAFNVESSAAMSLKAAAKFAVDASGIYQNSGASTSVKGVDPLQVNSLPGAGLNSSGVWRVVPNALSTIVTVAPTHEPYSRGYNGVFFQPTSPGIQPKPYKGTIDATKTAASAGVQNAASIKDLRNQPAASAPVGTLSQDQTTALLAQAGSGNDYTSVDADTGAVGKYQIDYQALVDGGYVKSSVASNEDLQNPNSWIGKNGIDSVDALLDNAPEQESIMAELTSNNYTAMVASGAISEEQPPEDVAGMLALAHEVGVDAAKNFREGQGTGADIFNQGKYAASILAGQVQAVNQG